MIEVEVVEQVSEQRGSGIGKLDARIVCLSLFVKCALFGMGMNESAVGDKRSHLAQVDMNI